MSATNNTPVSVPDRRIPHSMSSTPQETYEPILLERKADRICGSMDAEKVAQRAVCTFFGQDRSWQTIMTKSLSRPFVLFVHEPIVQLLGIYMAYLYGLLYRKSSILRQT
ncbi:hypothetical protein BDR06DRAFT_1023546 [Suillus hirtellus]|nr:hypothetical protein BDR06DRAFT_1023546 [Suillus hirtellus]